jgi:hypothetical protein
MTQLKLKNGINESQMSILLHLLHSWNVETEVETDTKINYVSTSALPFSTGMWADYDIDDKTLRAKAWGTAKRTVL